LSAWWRHDSLVQADAELQTVCLILEYLMRLSVPAGGENLSPLKIPTLLAPELARANSELALAIYTKSKLSLREFEAARMATAYINGCMICQMGRSATNLAPYVKSIGGDPAASVLKNGAAPDEAFYQDVRDWRKSELFSPRERLAIEMAEGMGVAPRELAVDEAFWDRARALFSDSELMDLCLCIGGWMGAGRAFHVLGIDSFCAMPARPF
jgi:alkylhydroperoxidase family enzyme